MNVPLFSPSHSRFFSFSSRGLIACLILLSLSQHTAAPNHLAVIGPDDVHNLKPLYSLRGKAIAFLNKDRIVSGSIDDNMFRIWDLATKKVTASSTNNKPIYAIVSSPDGSKIVTMQYDGLLRVWNDKGQHNVLFRDEKLKLLNADFSPDGKFLATSWEKRTVRIFDAKNNALIKSVSSDEGDVFCLKFSHDGAVLAAGEAVSGLSIRLWNVGDWSVLHTFKGCLADVHSLEFSSDDKTLVSASKKVRFWDIADRRERDVLSFNTHMYFRAVYSPDNRLLFAVGDDVQIWDIKKKALLRTLDFSHPVSDFKISPDGGKLVIALWNNEIVVYGLPNGL